jgi:hypothetical protein
MRTPVRKLALWSGVSLVLAAVFLLYMQPQMMVALGDMIWACFQ